MKYLLYWLLGLALAFGGFATTDTDFTTADGGPAWDGPIYQNNEKAIVETWIGRSAINVGWIVGDEMFKVAKSIMQEKCPDNPKKQCKNGKNTDVKTSRVTTYPHVAEDSHFSMRVTGKWSNNAFREMLIELAAMALQHLTSGQNCYDVISTPGRQLHCNMGNFIFINMATEFINDHRENFIRVYLYGPDGQNTVHGEFKCCKTLGPVDTVVDSKSAPISKLYHGVEMTRDAKCLISFRYGTPPVPETTCGECGPKCDSCPAECPDVCPKHKCNGLVSRGLPASDNADPANTFDHVPQIADTSTPSVVPEIAATNHNFTAFKSQKEKWDQVVYQHNNKALIETWIGRTAINVGHMTGSKLYAKVKPQLDRQCQNDDNDAHACETPEMSFRTTRIVKFPNVEENAFFFVTMWARFDNSRVRDMLIELAARTMESLTSTAENCYNVPGHDAHCNIGNFININLPQLGESDNFIRVRIWGQPSYVYNEFKCCRSLGKVDQVTDHRKLDIQKLWGKEYTRDAKCLIAFQTTCGQCGPKCDACGGQCKDVCPNHDCSKAPREPVSEPAIPLDEYIPPDHWGVQTP